MLDIQFEIDGKKVAPQDLGQELKDMSSGQLPTNFTQS
jgi:hypothetical protein